MFVVKNRIFPPPVEQSGASPRSWHDNARRLAALGPGHQLRAGRAVLGIVALLFGLFVLQGLARNPAFDWPTVGEYFFTKPVLDGLVTTLELTALSMSLALVMSVVIANMRLSKNPVLRAISGVYVWFFRSIPLLVLLILWFNFSLLYPQLSLGVPFGPKLFSFSTAQVINAYWAAVLAFGLQQAAYTSEIIRSALLAVPTGQREAASALGMTKARAFLRIVLPQAMRIAVPPIGNDTINLLKATSLVAFISVPDLLYSVQQIYNRTYNIVPLLMVACIWYMIFVSILSIGQFFLERRLRRVRRAAGQPELELELDLPHRGAS